MFGLGKRFQGRPRLPLLASIIGLSGLALMACSTGAYPIDVFPEGHYQPSYRSQEPPRLEPPANSVPISGREIAYDFSQAARLSNPLPPTPETLTEATQIYQVNCAVCHGATGRGDGPMARYFREAGVSPPVDFTSARVRARQEGELYWVLTNGLGNMPRFGPLLTPKQRWAVVSLVTSVSRGAR